MVATVTVLYPNVSDAKFDMDYYQKTHMPLVMDKLGPHGLTGYRVYEFPAPDAPYAVQCTLDFDTVEQVEQGLAAEGGPVMGDVPNFSNQNPVILIGSEVHRG